MQPFDQAIFDIIHGLQLAALDPIIKAIEFLGETVPSIILPLPIVAWLWLKGFRREASWFIIALIGISLASVAVKVLVDRTRPNGDPFSFVSGHTSYFTVFFGYLYLTARKVVTGPPLLIFLKTGLVVLLVLTGFSRIYLGEHWPTDVLGGFILGVLVLMPVLWQVDNVAGLTQ